MATTKEELKAWFKQGVKLKATHMIVVCDTWDHDDFPVYVLSTQNVREIEGVYNKKPMQQVMEVYNLSKPMDEQMAERRAFNY